MGGGELQKCRPTDTTRRIAPFGLALFLPFIIFNLLDFSIATRRTSIMFNLVYSKKLNFFCIKSCWSNYFGVKRRMGLEVRQCDRKSFNSFENSFGFQNVI